MKILITCLADAVIGDTTGDIKKGQEIQWDIIIKNLELADIPHDVEDDRTIGAKFLYLIKE